MSIYSSGRKSRRASRSQLGHLKLSVYEESSALTVYVYEARGLMRQESAPLDSYVKIYLLPDTHKVTKQKTKIKKQKDPVFNEKFSFILNEKEDIDKMLFISVWGHHTTSRNDMIGCMTFKVVDLLGPGKHLKGWYQLLGEEKGRNEFSQVPSSISRYDSPYYNLGQPPGVKTFAVTLVRSEKGYGFNVNGHSPVYVSQITKGLPAHDVDVQTGDYIVEVEGTEVTRASADLVVRIVRKCPQMLHLILQRPTTQPPRHALSSYVTNSLRRSRQPRKGLLGSMSYASIPSVTTHSSQQFSHSQYLVPEYHQHSAATRRLSAPISKLQGTLTQPEGNTHEGAAQYHHSRIPKPEDHVNHHMLKSVAGQVISARSSFNLSTQRKSRDPLYSSQGKLRQRERVMDPTKTLPSTSNDSGRHLSQQLQGDVDEGSLVFPTAHPRHSLTQCTAEEQEDVFMRNFSQDRMPQMGGANYHQAKFNSTDSAYSSDSLRTDVSGAGGPVSPTHHVQLANGGEDISVDWESLGSLGQQRQKAIQNLLSAELTFCEELRIGIETYIEPLRSVIPTASHERMFLGLKQLFDVSMAISGQLKARRVPFMNESPPVLMYVENIADLYWSKLNELVERLKVTLDNTFIARQEIADSFTSTDFARLVEDSVVQEKKASIYSFVESVNEYLPKLTKSLFALNYLTPLNHEDHRHLFSVTDALMVLCRDKELVQRWNKELEMMKHLQLCIGFEAGKVKPFRVMIPGRLLIRDGEMTLIERRKKKKVWVLLFSDILLITCKQGKILTSVAEPILLQQLMIQDFHCSDPAEIQLSTVDGTWTRLVRAGSVCEKEEWMLKIKERASGSLSNRRKHGDKPRSGIQPHIQNALRKQSQHYQINVVPSDLSTNTVLSSVSPLPEGGGEASQLSSPLKRVTAKRRSLFNVGSKRERKDPAEKETAMKLKRSSRTGSKSSLPKKQTLADIDVDTLRQWETSFTSLIASCDGLELFEEFLKSEFSEENIQFWKACERFKTVPLETLTREAEAIYNEYIIQHAAKWVNIDHQTTKDICNKISSPDRLTFSKAQQQVYLLMARDSFVRFVKSESFQLALRR